MLKEVLIEWQTTEQRLGGSGSHADIWRGGPQEAQAKRTAWTLEELREAGVVQAVSRRREKMKSAR